MQFQLQEMCRSTILRVAAGLLAASGVGAVFAEDGEKNELPPAIKQLNWQKGPATLT